MIASGRLFLLWSSFRMSPLFVYESATKTRLLFFVSESKQRLGFSLSFVAFQVFGLRVIHLRGLWDEAVSQIYSILTVTWWIAPKRSPFYFRNQLVVSFHAVTAVGLKMRGWSRFFCSRRTAFRRKDHGPRRFRGSWKFKGVRCYCDHWWGEVLPHDN